jgi:hypothetical protein
MSNLRLEISDTYLEKSESIIFEWRVTISQLSMVLKNLHIWMTCMIAARKIRLQDYRFAKRKKKKRLQDYRAPCLFVWFDNGIALSIPARSSSIAT